MKYIKKTGITNKGQLIDYSNELTEHAVHLRFEQAALKKMLARDTPVVSGLTLDEVWHKNIVAPNMERSSLLISAFAFCENQIKTLLYDYISIDNNYTIFSCFKHNAAAEPPDLIKVRLYIQKKWLTALKEYVSYECIEYIQQTNILRKKLEKLKKLRNAITHNGGLITTEFDDTFSMAGSTSTGITGIYSLAGFVYITADGIKALEELVDETTELLCNIQ